MNNGLTKYEVAKLKNLRELASYNLEEAKKQANTWVNSNQSRKNRRRQSLRTVKGMHANIHE